MGEFDRIVAAMSESPVIAAFTEMSVSGDVSSLEKNGAKRHHFLPQRLLRSFASEADDRERIFQMETTGRAAPRKVGLRGAASRNLLYAIEDEDGLLSNRP